MSMLVFSLLFSAGQLAPQIALKERCATLVTMGETDYMTPQGLLTRRSLSGRHKEASPSSCWSEIGYKIIKRKNGTGMAAQLVEGKTLTFDP